MKQWHLLFAFALCAMVVATTSCNKRKAEPIKIDGLETYTDKVTEFSIQYPKNWTKRSENGKFMIVNAIPEGDDRFFTYKIEGPSGAKIDVRVSKDSIPLKDFINDDKLAEDKYYTGPIESKIGSYTAQKLMITFPAKDGNFYSEKYYVQNDSMITSVEFAAFGSTFDEYKQNFEKIMASFKPAHRPIEQKVETQVVQDTTKKGPELPSPTFSTAPGSGFTISIPDNFNTKGVKAAGAISGTEFYGGRLDCTIRVDVLDASKQTNIDKIANDNKAGFGGSNPQSTTLGGVKAYRFDYTPAAGISRRVYLAVKDGKLYRVFVTWNNAEKDVYLPVFEKSMASFKFN